MLPSQKYAIEILPQLVAGVDDQVCSMTWVVCSNLNNTLSSLPPLLWRHRGILSLAQLLPEASPRPCRSLSRAWYECLQIKQGTYNLEANLALLRFYLIQPGSIDLKVLAKVLLLSLMQLPSSDFKVCLHLIPERLHQVGICSRLWQLSCNAAQMHLGSALHGALNADLKKLHVHDFLPCPLPQFLT